MRGYVAHSGSIRLALRGYVASLHTPRIAVCHKEGNDCVVCVVEKAEY